MTSLNVKNMDIIREQICHKAEHYSHYCMKLVRILPMEMNPLPVNDLAYTYGCCIYTKTLDELILLHEMAHIIQKMRGEVKLTNCFHGYPVNQCENLEIAAWKMANEIQSYSSIPYVGEYLNVIKPNDIIQGNLGMEFQTIGGKWNVRQLKKVIREDSAYYIDGGAVNSEINIVDFNDGFKVGADGFDLEYETIAVQESDKTGKLHLENKAVLNKAAHKAGVFQKNIGNIHVGAILGNLEARKIELKQNSKEYKITYWIKDLGRGKIIILNPKGYRNAHPQVTAGITFSGINRVVRELSESQEDSFLYGSTHSSLAPQQQMNTFQEVQDMEQQHITYKGKNHHISNKTKGLIKLIQLNVIQFKRGSATGWFSHNRKLPINDKSALPLMQRTSFLSIYKELKNKARRVIREGLRRHRTTHDFFGMIIADDDLIGGQQGAEILDEHDEVVGYKPDEIITFKKWRDAFLRKSDLLETHFNGVSAVNNRKKSDHKRFHMLNATDIGSSKHRGALLEFRALKRDVDPDHWGDVANEAFDLVVYANTKQRISSSDPSETEATI